MNEITSTPEAINPSVVDAIRHQYKEVSAMVGVHPSILYAQAVLRPSLALAQGHALSIIQGIEVDVHEYRTSNELPGFDTAMLKMVADLKETASQLSDKEKAIIPVGETIPKDWVVSAEVGHGHAGERPCVETLRISIRTGQQMILAMLYSRNMMIVYEFVKTDLTKVISKFCAEFKPRKKGYISYVTIRDNSLQLVRQENTDNGVIIDEAYPNLMPVGGANQFVDNYLSSSTALVNLYGVAGSGKSTLATKMATRAADRTVILVDNALFYRDPGLAQQLIAKVRELSSEGEKPFLILEEVDKHIQEKTDGNDFLTQLLSLTSGVLKTDVKIACLSNLNSATKILDALQRSGRSYANVEFVKHTPEQAAACRKAMGMPEMKFDHNVNLADAICEQVLNVGSNKAGMGFAA